MIIVDSPFHLTFSSCHYFSSRACTGKCKKVWWDFDFSAKPDNGACHQCGDSLENAVEGVHFKIVKKSNRPFKPKDFKGFKEFSNDEVEEITRLIRMNTGFNHMSKVKAAFVEKAKREWR